MAQGSSLLRVPPSHPAPHPIQPSQTPAKLYPPQWGLGGLTGASVPWAPAHRRQRLFLAQRKSNVLRFSILSSKAEEVEQPLTPGCLCGAGQAARQGGCGAASAPQGGCGCPRVFAPQLPPWPLARQAVLEPVPMRSHLQHSPKGERPFRHWDIIPPFPPAARSQ